MTTVSLCFQACREDDASMALTTAVHVLVFTLLYVAVVLGQNVWGVTYSTQSICGLNGSTLEMSCSYTFPSGTVTSTLWFSKGPDNNPVNLTGDSDYTGRVTYCDNLNNNNTLIITDLRQSDSAEYKFRFTTDANQWTGAPGITLIVTGLRVNVTPATVTEGQNVTLTCITSCPLTDNPTYIWYKKNVTSPKASGPSYSITNIRSEDSGEYYCEAQNIYGRHNSSSVSVDVQYAPKNISVSNSPSGEIVEGGSVTLTCSSDANPPVNKYIWYKKNVTTPKASVQSYSITNITSENSGEYYCEAQNIYGCPNSSSVFVDVQYAPKNILASVSPFREIAEGSSVTLTCSSDANPPVDNYTWYKKTVTSPKESGPSYSITNITSEDSGEYYCEAKNRIGNKSSDLVCLMVLKKQSYEMHLVVGISVVIPVLILCLSGFMWFRKKAPKSVSETKDKSDNEQGNANPTNCNISSVGVTSEKRDQSDDLHYTSVDIHRAKMQDVPLYSNAQPQEQDEDVQYAAVKFNPPSAATQPVMHGVEEEPSVLYSTVNILRIKRT